MFSCRSILETIREVDETDLSYTSAQICNLRNEADECLAALDAELGREKERRRRLANDVGVLTAHVTELWDRVDKARRAEADLSQRVIAWATHVNEKIHTATTKEMRMAEVLDSSAELSAEMAAQLEKLGVKREAVATTRAEIDERRVLHKNLEKSDVLERTGELQQQLRALRNEMTSQERALGVWEQEADELAAAVRNLEKMRDDAVQRLDALAAKDEDEQKRLEQLQAILMALSGGNGSTLSNASSLSVRHRCKYDVSVSTISLVDGESHQDAH